MKFNNVSILVASFLLCINIKICYSNPVKKLKSRENPAIPPPLETYTEESESTSLFPPTSENGKTSRKKTTSTAAPLSITLDSNSEVSIDQTSITTQSEVLKIPEVILEPITEETAPTDLSSVFIGADNVHIVEEPSFNEYNLKLYTPDLGKEENNLLAANLITALGLAPQSSFTEALLAAYALPDGPQLVQNLLSQLILIDDNLVLLIVKSLGKDALKNQGLTEENLTDFLLDDDSQILFLLKKLIAEAAKGRTPISIPSEISTLSSSVSPLVDRAETLYESSEEFDEGPLNFSSNPDNTLLPHLPKTNKFGLDILKSDPNLDYSQNKPPVSELFNSFPLPNQGNEVTNTDKIFYNQKPVNNNFGIEFLKPDPNSVFSQNKPPVSEIFNSFSPSNHGNGVSIPGKNLSPQRPVSNNFGTSTLKPDPNVNFPQNKPPEFSNTLPISKHGSGVSQTPYFSPFNPNPLPPFNPFNPNPLPPFNPFNPSQMRRDFYQRNQTPSFQTPFSPAFVRYPPTLQQPQLSHEYQNAPKP